RRRIGQRAPLVGGRIERLVADPPHQHLLAGPNSSVPALESTFSVQAGGELPPRIRGRVVCSGDVEVGSATLSDDPPENQHLRSGPHTRPDVWRLDRGGRKALPCP